MNSRKKGEGGEVGREGGGCVGGSDGREGGLEAQIGVKGGGGGGVYKVTDCHAILCTRNASLAR